MKKFKTGFRIILALIIFGMINQSFMLAKEKGIKTATRVTTNFNSTWLFFRGEIKDDAAQAPAFNDAEWQPVHLPHAPQILALRHPWKPDTEGINWYRKHFQLPLTCQNHKIFIEFEGADQVTDVWVNGAHLSHHIGAYLPFMVDITEQVIFGLVENIIAVKVDNRRNRDIPVYGNWISYGGLYRDVHLIITDRLHITDALFAQKPAGGGVFITYPQVTESLAQINIKTHVLNEYQQPKNCKIKTHLLDANQRLIATVTAQEPLNAGTDHTFEQFIELKAFHRWHPNQPYLYQIYSEIYDRDQLVDSYQTRIGIRRIQFSYEGGFTINGERLTFMGTNRVQDYPYLAWAFPNSAQRRDAQHLKEAGFQFIRSSHNPQDPSFLDTCDELGILVMDCIPGFQYIGGAQFREYSFQNMREMIRRDRNHPSVILWELSLNETDFDSAFAQNAMQIGHEEFPGDQCFIAGWKFPSIYDVFLRATQHGARNYTQKTPLVISEYGHWDYGGGRSTSDVERMRGETAMLVQAHNHQESLNLNRNLSFLCGDGLWVGIDFQCFPSGVIDYFRLPKFSYYFYQSQRDPALIFEGIDSGPMVFIANYWTEKSPSPIIIYSNCERIDLLLNDQLIVSQLPDTGKFVQNLLHPPFTFQEVPWQPGKLTAHGYIKNQKVAVHTRMTPCQATALTLSFDVKEAALANGEDVFWAYASVVDENGTVLHDAEKEVVFQVTGPGILINPTPIKTEAGVASALIRTTTQEGEIVIKASTEDLKAAVEIKKCLRTN